MASATTTTATTSDTRLNISDYTIDIKNNPSIMTNVAVVGLGATGSAFILLLGHFLKYNLRYNVTLYDFDHINRRNYKVSMYGFYEAFDVRYEGDSKAMSSYRFLQKLTRNYAEQNHNSINFDHDKVTRRRLERSHSKIDYIFIFTDNNKSRHEMSLYQQDNPDTVIFDCRVGSYCEFEVYLSANPTKYAKTIYYNDDGSLQELGHNNVCLDDRMNFSVAMASSSLVMNLFTKYLRDEIKDDFQHIMIGNDFVGRIEGYE